MTSETKTAKGPKKAQRIDNPLTKRLYDLKEAAIYLARPVFSVRGLIWKGALPVIRDGRKLYLDIVDMNKWIDRSRTTIE